MHFGTPERVPSAQALQAAAGLLDFVGLAEKAAIPARDLTLVNQKLLEVARALATKPDVLLLDEIMAGLNPTEITQAMELVSRIRGQGITIFMIEHVMKAIMSICDRIIVLHHGKKIAEGAPRALIETHIEPAVVEVFGEGLEAWTQAHAAQLCQRSERVGETLFCYTTAPDNVIEALKHAPALRYLHRPSNLEDVFLKLTGRDLRD